jgi:putative solute:sodium symporter small subunit
MRNTIERLHSVVLTARLDAYWARTRKLMLVMLGLWIFYFLVVHIFITTLNKVTVPVLGLPLGYYLAVQGSLVVFLVSLFWFGRKQNQS